jgi:NAD(P)-dependent dehydrogenase (short-subunit alcohol dehydrogenase family)
MKEMAPKKVRVNSVNPGGVQTKILQANMTFSNSEEEKKVFTKKMTLTWK